SHNETTELTTILLNQTINANTTGLKLTLTYNGTLNDNLRGFYRSSYKKGNETRWLATTHFEPTSARQAFPCWDEPAIKATFQISIKRPSNTYHVLSNTLMIKTNKTDGYVEFEETPEMSTYLVAFVVSDFTSNQNKDRNFSVWSNPTVNKESRMFALKYGEKTLKKLSDFTNYPYNNNMKKMDQIAIPQFAAGAMENWGLVTYRENALLYDKEVDTTEAKQSVATVIAHEFAHQWFGNLVTCKWWNSIWLNEGFATFFQYYIPDLIEEKETGVKDNWRLMEQFAVRALQASAFVVDAKKDTRALTVDENTIQTPEQISNLFDDIAYRKGGCILRMMQQFLTEEVFKLGLQGYLKNYKHESVQPDQLFDAMYKAQTDNIKKLLPDKIEFKDVMNNWVYKPGYPVVTVTRNKTSVKLTQERFFLDFAHSDDTAWYIPITYVTNKSSNKKLYWLKPNESLVLPLNEFEPNNSWILFNKDQTGYYRVNYDDEGWKHLTNCLSDVKCHQNISAVSRAQLIDDASNLARAGHTSYNNSLSVTVYLSHETDYIPWYAAARTFDYLNDLLWGTNVYEKYQEYVSQKVQNFAKKHDYKNSTGTHVEKLAKALAFKLACKYGKKGDSCVSYAEEQLDKWLEPKPNDTKIWQDLKNDILCVGLRHANYLTLANVLDKYLNSTGDEKKAILNGLGCNMNKSMVITLLEMSITTKEENVFDAMASVHSNNPGSFDVLFEFIQRNITQIKEKDTPEGTGLAGTLNKLATKVRSDEQLAKLVLFAHEHLEDEQTTKAIVSAANNLKAIKSHRDEISKWVEKQPTSKEKPTEPSSASFVSLTSFLIIIPILLTRFN
ncbi:aminopeptidase N-like, partial [Pseudomyrmex gracilis]|uniref:aminopeptidase N-like n=1 Tax=Pseudomyrmex gracilis TaxID=219809 RepID=UPI000995306B